jgi:hypothetical protein
MERYREVLTEIARVLKTGGTLFLSVRSQYNQLLREVQAGRFEAARRARDARSSLLGEGPVGFTWQTVEEMRLILNELGFEIDSSFGIGVLSGTHTDPLSAVAEPSRLAEESRAELLELELSLAEQYAALGRYIAAIATKK